MKCTVEITPVDKDGNPVGETVCRENDLFTHNFGLWLSMYFKPYDIGAPLPAWSISLLDTAGIPRTVYTWTTDQYASLHMVEYAAGPGFNIGVGTGVTAANRTDTNLESPVGTWQTAGGITQAQWLPTSGVLKFSGVVFIPTNTAITECGLALKLWFGAGTTDYWFLMSRDVFSAINIAGGNYASVTYTISL